jgi:tRNA (Thr-GGU) A37 N-methylase
MRKTIMAFSIRHFNCPNPTGFSIVGLLSARNCYLEVTELDILDGTPIIDIKPYVCQFDHRDDVTNGWVNRIKLDKSKKKSITPKSFREDQK